MCFHVMCVCVCVAAQSSQMNPCKKGPNMDPCGTPQVLHPEYHSIHHQQGEIPKILYFLPVSITTVDKTWAIPCPLCLQAFYITHIYQHLICNIQYRDSCTHDSFTPTNEQNHLKKILTITTESLVQLCSTVKPVFKVHFNVQRKCPLIYPI